MKILLYAWSSYLQHDIELILQEKAINVSTFFWTFENKNEDEKFEKWFIKHIDTSVYDAILSVNYWPMLSKVAQQQGIRYIAWCYDNPLNVVNVEKTLGNSVNSVFFFDKIQAQKYIDAGFDTVYYLPLGVNATRLGQLKVTKEDLTMYGADVSLVGSLYESRFHEIRNLLDEHDRGYVDSVLAAQQNLYGCYLYDDVITDDFVNGINDKIKNKHPDTSFVLLKEALTFAMASENTRKDRIVLLTLLGRRYDTHLYSYQESEILKGVKCHPSVDYVKQMPKIFASSRINLNPSLRCIQSGIPLRALDIMGSGGFLLSNYQQELVEQFVDGEEMVVYDSMEDAVEKTDFYLKNPDLRERIILNGKKKVLTQYTLQERLDSIFKISKIEM